MSDTETNEPDETPMPVHRQAASQVCRDEAEKGG